MAVLIVGCDDIAKPTPPVDEPTPTKPGFGSNTVSDQRYVAGVPVPVLTLPQASGGDGTLTYRLHPEVPGLTFSADSRTLKGVPAAAGTHSMRYEARDEDGDTASLSFRLVAEPLTSLYWSTGNLIERAGLDGQDREVFLGSASAPIAVKVTQEHMYWIELSVGTFKGKIRRANRDGSSAEDLVTDLGLALDLAIDAAGGKIFWTEMELGGYLPGGKLRSANLDGTDRKDLYVIEGQGAALASVAWDAVDEKLYWTQQDQSGYRVRRWNRDGTNVETVLMDEGRLAIFGNVILPGLELVDGQMYFALHGGISRANLDGTGLEPLITVDSTDVGISTGISIALDAETKKIYWTESSFGQTSKIRRANLDGTDDEDIVVVASDSFLFGIEVDAGSRVIWTEAMLPEGLVGMATARIRQADLDGSDARDLMAAQFPTIIASALAVDVVARKIYAAAAAPRSGETETTIFSFWRANLDGTGLSVVIERQSPAYANVVGLALDIVEGKAYWAEQVSGHAGSPASTYIRRANLDGTDQQDLLTVDGDVQAIAVDAVGGRMYWTDGDTILSANLDGMGQKDLEVEGSSGIGELAIDAAARKLYWSAWDHDDGAVIRRANLDGTGQEDLEVEGSSGIGELAIDAAARKLYWSAWDHDDRADVIRRANLDGTDQQDLVTGEFVTGIALGTR